MNFLLSHPVFTVKNPRLSWETQKKMNAYRKKHPKCEITGIKPSFWGRNSDVHHEFPVQYFPELAADPKYYHTFVRDIHFVFGHLKNWRDYNMNLAETIKKARESYQKYGKSYLKGNQLKRESNG